MRSNGRGEDASSSRSRHHSALDDGSEQRATRGVRGVVVGEASAERFGTGEVLDEFLWDLHHRPPPGGVEFAVVGGELVE